MNIEKIGILNQKIEHFFGKNLIDSKINDLSSFLNLFSKKMQFVFDNLKNINSHFEPFLKSIEEDIQKIPQWKPILKNEKEIGKGYGPIFPESLINNLSKEKTIFLNLPSLLENTVNKDLNFVSNQIRNFQKSVYPFFHKVISKAGNHFSLPFTKEVNFVENLIQKTKNIATSPLKEAYLGASKLLHFPEQKKTSLSSFDNTINIHVHYHGGTPSQEQVEKGVNKIKQVLIGVLHV